MSDQAQVPELPSYHARFTANLRKYALHYVTAVLSITAAMAIGSNIHTVNALNDFIECEYNTDRQRDAVIRLNSEIHEQNYQDDIKLLTDLQNATKPGDGDKAIKDYLARKALERSQRPALSLPADACGAPPRR